MSNSKSSDKVSAIRLIKSLPYNEFENIASQTHVDYKAKKLTGINVMADCILAMLSSSRPSQRIISMENGLPIKDDIAGRKTMPRQCVSHSSLSERLDNIEISFFEKSYSLLCSRYRKFVPEDCMDGTSITRIDSTMVAETANKLAEGFTTGITKKACRDRRQLKYTMAYDGLAVTAARVFTAAEYSSDNAPISKVACQCLRRRKGFSDGYVFDRALCDVTDFAAIAGLSEKKEAFFVGRLNLSRCTEKLDSLLPMDMELHDCQVEITDDYTGYLRAKNSAKWDKSVKYRIIRVRFLTPRPENPRNSRRHRRHFDDEMVLITNNMKAQAIDIVRYYRRRWDIEVFFKFLKQELGFSHFISTSVHGIKVMLYMTLIVALLVKIYAMTHDMGPRLAKIAIINEIISYQENRIKDLEAINKKHLKEIKSLKSRLLAKNQSSDH